MQPNDIWQYDETRKFTIDYLNDAAVKVYDEHMSKFRDIQEEVDEIIEAINLREGQTMLEFGTGTGEFALRAAGYCKHVLAVDISKKMLEYAEKKAKSNNITNIRFINSGFLTYEHEGNSIDAIVSQIALHHLPDFWKMIALRRINLMLKEGGRFYLKDIVFSMKIGKYRESINYWINDMEKTAGSDIAQETVTHVKEEFSTFDWIMEEMLYRAGFDINTADYEDNFFGIYVCTKRPGKERRRN